MKMTITQSEFVHEFQMREPYKENFSSDGLRALYDYLEEIDPDYDLDVIALFCDYREGDIGATLDDYNLSSIEELEETTTVIWKDEDSALFRQF